MVYVEDSNEPGAGIDRFWIDVTGGLKLGAPAATYAEPIDGGNIVVPHTISTSGTTTGGTTGGGKKK
jgi:hypothetical protein